VGDLEFVTSFAGRTLAGARVRPYGVEVADLAVDFDAPRALVTTRVLAACLHCEESAVWQLAVQTRLLLLLGISELSLADPVEAHVPCGCGEVAMIELTASELARFAAERHRDQLVARAGDAAVTLRLPTGVDQLRWAQLDPRGDIVRGVLADLVVAGDLTDELVVAADALLGEVDPLVDFELESICPHCRTPLAQPVDLERIALARLRHARRTLLEQVHAIAAAYHWTEPTIAALPPWRRAEYAALASARPR
jgi:hypothetical protein